MSISEYLCSSDLSMQQIGIELLQKQSLVIIEAVIKECKASPRLLPDNVFFFDIIHEFEYNPEYAKEMNWIKEFDYAINSI